MHKTELSLESLNIHEFLLLLFHYVPTSISEKHRAGNPYEKRALECMKYPALAVVLQRHLVSLFALIGYGPFASELCEMSQAPYDGISLFELAWLGLFSVFLQTVLKA